jgi:hypothetical protein
MVTARSPGAAGWPGRLAIAHGLAPGARFEPNSRSSSCQRVRAVDRTAAHRGAPSAARAGRAHRDRRRRHSSWAPAGGSRAVSRPERGGAVTSATAADPLAEIGGPTAVHPPEGAVNGAGLVTEPGRCDWGRGPDAQAVLAPRWRVLEGQSFTRLGLGQEHRCRHGQLLIILLIVLRSCSGASKLLNRPRPRVRYQELKRAAGDGGSRSTEQARRPSRRKRHVATTT